MTNNIVEKYYAKINKIYENIYKECVLNCYQLLNEDVYELKLLVLVQELSDYLAVTSPKIFFKINQKDNFYIHYDYPVWCPEFYLEKDSSFCYDKEHMKTVEHFSKMNISQNIQKQVYTLSDILNNVSLNPYGVANHNGFKNNNYWEKIDANSSTLTKDKEIYLGTINKESLTEVFNVFFINDISLYLKKQIINYEKLKLEKKLLLKEKPKNLKKI